MYLIKNTATFWKYSHKLNVTVSMIQVLKKIFFCLKKKQQKTPPFTTALRHVNILSSWRCYLQRSHKLTYYMKSELPDNGVQNYSSTKSLDDLDYSTICNEQCIY